MKPPRPQPRCAQPAACQRIALALGGGGYLPPECRHTRNANSKSGHYDRSELNGPNEPLIGRRDVHDVIGRALRDLPYGTSTVSLGSATDSG